MSSLFGGGVKIVILSLVNKRVVTFCDNIRYLNYPTVRFKGRTLKTEFLAPTLNRIRATYPMQHRLADAAFLIHSLQWLLVRHRVA